MKIRIILVAMKSFLPLHGSLRFQPFGGNNRASVVMVWVVNRVKVLLHAKINIPALDLVRRAHALFLIVYNLTLLNA